MTLYLVPVNLATAQQFVAMWHRHLPPPPGHKFSIGVAHDDGIGDELRVTLVGVIMVGRPIARAYDDGHTLEVNRSATDGTEHANSKLYAAAWRATKALGYRRLITYTQAGETGASLRGAGWQVVAERPPRKGWDTPSRPRTDRHTTEIARTLWEAV